MKAILVIDKMPQYCTDCQLYDSEYDYCYALKDVLGDDFYCPLRNLPQKKEMKILKNGNYEETKYIKGFNDCINELLGEEE